MNTTGRFYILSSQPTRCPDGKRAENLAAKIHNYKCGCKFLLDINEDMKIIVKVIQYWVNIPESAGNAL